MTDAIQPPTRYRPRRRRSGDPLPCQVTPRDLDILRAVARYRFLNSRHITALVQGSPKNLRTRLKLLFEHGLLDRPECQYDFYRPGGGSSLAVYALGDKGARLLEQPCDGMDGHSMSWTRKNRSAGRPFLEHALAVADFAVDLAAAVRRHHDIELADGAELVGRFPTATREMARPLRLSVPVVNNGARHVIGIEPDYAFSLGFPQLRQRANYLVEIDRGTMPIERADLAASSILRKLLAYREVWRSSQHSQQFGWRNFRVLIVTTAADRAAGMRDCARRHLGAADAALFWFAERPHSGETSPLQCKWIDGAGGLRSIAAVPA